MSFENAAVTKGLMITCGITSIFAGIFDIKHYFHVQFVPHISRHHQYWRLITHHLAFSNSSDLFLGELLLYNAGVHIERRFGSVKYASFAFVSLVISTLLELLSLLLFHRAGINHFAMGPSALLFSILYQYSRIIPPVYTYRIFGLPLNNKSVIYFIAFQLAISQPLNSVAVALIGVLAGQIYRSDLAGFNTYRLPPGVLRFAQRFLAPLVGSLRPPRRSNRALPEDAGPSAPRRSPESSDLHDDVTTTARLPRPGNASLRPRASDAPALSTPSVMRGLVNDFTGRTDRANVGLRVPTEDEISHLTSMFPSLDREVLVGALQRSPNIEAAVETLLLSQN